jgi:nitrite reductase/ring-hydroxylating ferredoxin subunit
MAALLTPSTDGRLTVKLAEFPVLGTAGGFIGLMHDTNYPVLISRLTVGFRAMRGQCPHAGGTVIPNGTNLRCTNHGSLFDHEGNAFAGPATGGHLPQYELAYQSASGLLEITIPDTLYRITAVALTGADRLLIDFETRPGVKYEVRFRSQLTGTESVVPFATTPAGLINNTELTASGSNQSVYVARPGQTGFFTVNVKVTQL